MWGGQGGLQRAGSTALRSGSSVTLDVRVCVVRRVAQYRTSRARRPWRRAWPPAGVYGTRSRTRTHAAPRCGCGTEGGEGLHPPAVWCRCEQRGPGPGLAVTNVNSAFTVLNSHFTPGSCVLLLRPVAMLLAEWLGVSAEHGSDTRHVPEV